ncbi:hypothetical protein E6C27_scaffold89G001440 [Cucumis melo var. makuwa]|uniref:Uncharacterized protein n=1 Tax=Cucumis melo var. makuwa TaxID=1194695 RepID=A0A5A7V3M4_CUCMM|nr:hypothetical protein E6C27_scaffold89G001440 [Cucumis melo var. makuwa]
MKAPTTHALPLLLQHRQHARPLSRPSPSSSRQRHRPFLFFRPLFSIVVVHAGCVLPTPATSDKVRGSRQSLPAVDRPSTPPSSSSSSQNRRHCPFVFTVVRPPLVVVALICASFGITRLICASFGITRPICASFEITRLLCASFGIARLICVSFGITRLCKGNARDRPARGKKDV